MDIALSRVAAGSPEKQAAVWQRACTIKNEMAKFVQANPDMSDEKAKAWVHAQVGADIKLSGAQSLWGSR